MPVREIASDWGETGIGCIHCGEMTYSGGGPRQCVNPRCSLFAISCQPGRVADPSQVIPDSPNALDGDKMTTDHPAVVLAVGLSTVTISRTEYDILMAEMERVRKIQRMANALWKPRQNTVELPDGSSATLR